MIFQKYANFHTFLVGISQKPMEILRKFEIIYDISLSVYSGF